MPDHQQTNKDRRSKVRQEKIQKLNQDEQLTQKIDSPTMQQSKLDMHTVSPSQLDFIQNQGA